MRLTAAAGARVNAVKNRAWYKNSPPTPCAHTSGRCLSSPKRPVMAKAAKPPAPDTVKASAVNSSGGTSPAARDSTARNAQSPIAPTPAPVAGLNTCVVRH